MSTAVTKRPNETPSQALARILQAGKKQIEIAVGKAMDPDRMIRLAVSAMHQSPSLGDCSMISIANSVMLAAQLRLEINTSLGHAWLIPYGKVCTFQPGYRGLIELAHRSDRVHDVNSHLVYSADLFELEFGDNTRCVHKPHIGPGRGEWVGAYSHIRYKEGPPNALYMSVEEIEEIRDKASQSKNSEHGPWKKFPDEMRRKTVTKRLLKYVRLSVDDLARAVGLDDQADAIAAQPEAPKSPLRLQQETVLDADMLDMAEAATLELKGSAERQQEVRDSKLFAMGATEAQAQQATAVPSAMPPADTWTPSDEQASQQQRKRGRPAKQQAPAPAPVVAAEAVATPDAMRSTEEQLFYSLGVEGRQKLFSQLQVQLGEAIYRECVNKHLGALTYETYEDLQATLRSVDAEKAPW